MNILFICHGNICRSPMAEFIMKSLLKDYPWLDVSVSSCATSTEEIWGGIGNHIYPPAQKELKRQGIPFDENKRAVQLKKSDYEKYDLLIAMDNYNLRNIKRIIGADSQNKVHLLLEYTGENRDVSDPWYTRDFTTCFNDIYSGCKALLTEILNSHSV